MTKRKTYEGIKYPIPEMKDSADMRKEVFELLKMHLHSGFSMDCFTHLSLGEIHSFVSEYPCEFCAKQLEIVVREAKAGWENIGREQATGKCIGNSRSWYYNMQNRYGWTDKIDMKSDIKGNINVSVVKYDD